MNDMPLAYTAILDWVLAGLMFMIRPGAFVLSSPLLQSRSLPLNAKLTLVAFIAFFLLGQESLPIMSALSTSQLVFIIFVELAIGLCGGILLQIWFSIPSLAGEYAATSMGLGFARMVDFTNSGQSATIGQFLALAFLLLFLSLDGHLISLSILIDSYNVIPFGEGFDIRPFTSSALNAGSQMFVIAALMALPIVGGIFLVNIALGILTKIAPQMNLFSVGFPATILVGFFLLWASLPSIASLMREVVWGGEGSVSSAYSGVVEELSFE
jgi:flagellar biosynthetic protein FliR